MRNIDRTLLLLDEDDYKMFRWTQISIQKFVAYSERSFRWMKKGNPVDDPENSDTALHDQIISLSNIVILNIL